MGEMATDVAGLLAREAIRDLPLRYCDCVWRNDIDGLVGLFTGEGSFTAVFNGKEKTFSGRAELKKMFEGGLGISPRPFIHNHVVELAGDGFATGRCYLDLRSARKDMEILGAGYYEDAYVQTPQGWRFQSRRFVAVRMDELPPNIDA